MITAIFMPQQYVNVNHFELESLRHSRNILK